MLKTFAVAIASVVLGVTVALSVPAVAYHGPAFDAIRVRVAALEDEQDLQADQIRRLRDRADALRNRLSTQEELMEQAMLDIADLKDIDQQTAEALVDLANSIVGLNEIDQLFDARLDALES
jgi:hypothetical protein